MSVCNLCGAEGLTWLENMRKLVNPITGQQHGYNLCIIKIPRWEMSVAGVMCIRKADNIAADIVSRCIAAGKNPDTAQKRIEGDFIIIR